jgi:hypothetical protein
MKNVSPHFFLYQIGTQSVSKPNSLNLSNDLTICKPMSEELA